MGVAVRDRAQASEDSNRDVVTLSEIIGFLDCCWEILLITLYRVLLEEGKVVIVVHYGVKVSLA